eukprot:TRINITY_DN30075_c0_g1_i1.p1 TRINITY_DN30075_c0_g1~~TRINITY_DN30075_c0_g1_i1.p1  ORF type:complete len:110 (+),score=25.59 TRINITY_DN30075_c0_g1_i1:247-576(+)
MLAAVVGLIAGLFTVEAPVNADEESSAKELAAQEAILNSAGSSKDERLNKVVSVPEDLDAESLDSAGVQSYGARMKKSKRVRIKDDSKRPAKPYNMPFNIGAPSSPPAE